ncbi:MAG: hypothetical protein D8M61_17650 [Ignavibacteriae bacterium]|nr:hypothetical protein [Ignavibacteriota bacterium]
MTTFRKKYRLFSSAITLLLVNFLLFSPFFHHHHNEYSVDKVEKTLIHSHLLNHNSDTHNSEDKNHSSFDKVNHYHFIKLNSVFSINPSKGFKINLVSNFYATQFYFQDSFENEASRYVTSNPESQFQWEKYVHCAANVSPPLA